MPGFDVLDPSLDVFQNRFLEASAGTGKTFAIENIVVRLVKEGVPINEILVVTFTRAATFELKTRIRDHLKRENLSDALALFDEAKIFTIHAFCFHLLQEYAIEVGLSLEQDEQTAGSVRLHSAAKDFLRTQSILSPLQLERLLRSYRYDFDLLLTRLISSRRKLPGGPIFKELFESFSAKLPEPIAPETLCAEAMNYRGVCDRQKQIKPEMEKALTEFATLLSKRPFTSSDFDNLLDDPARAFLKLAPEQRLKKATGASHPLLQDTHLRSLLEAGSDLSLLFENLANATRAHLEAVIEKEDLLFFDDLLTRIARWVEKPAFAAEVRKKFRAVLIDEFQDTDALQWRIFSTLFLNESFTGPLYLVGDPKQSIYRFRNADIYTYMDAKRALGQDAFASLSTNYRSSPALIGALNHLFTPIQDLIALPKTGEVISCPPVFAPEEKETFQFSDGKGSLQVVEGEEEKDFYAFIISEIKRLHINDAIPLDAFAVLVKDRYQAERFQAACKFASLPAVTRRSRSLLNSLGFSVLREVITLLLDPRNPKALGKIVYGPLFRWELAEAAPEKLEEVVKLFGMLAQIAEKQGILSCLTTLFKRIPPVDPVLESDVRQLGEMAALEVDALDGLLPYLEHLQSQDPDDEKFKCYQLEDTSAVQIMTIHVSKGLEFDVVFPIGLLLEGARRKKAALEEAEEASERMRQLYVALTRAKKRLYLPVTKKPGGSVGQFLEKRLVGESLNDLVAQSETMSLAQVTQQAIYNQPIRKEEVRQQPEAPLERVLSVKTIDSFSSLTAHEYEGGEKLPGDGLPVGAEVGTCLHTILERIDFREAALCKRPEDFLPLIAPTIAGTLLGNFERPVASMLHRVFHTPLPLGFSLAEVDPAKCLKEMEFLYPTERGYLKGFIDLIFEHEGRVHLLDWKSNLLKNYDVASLKKAMEEHDYFLQASIYKEALMRTLSLCDSREIGETIYYFLRGGVYIV